MTADVQVYIPVYNDIAFLPEALDSVLAQKDVSLEVIVSDNVSSDGSYEYALERAREDCRIRVVRNGENVGMVRNFNLFKTHVTAPFFMILCSDDKLNGDSALSQACAVMARHDDVVSVYCDLLYIDAGGRRLAKRRFGRDGLFDASVTARRSILSSRNLFGIPLLHRTAACGSFSYPPELTYTGDIYMAAKVAEQGQIWHIPAPLIANRYTGANATAALHGQALAQMHLLAARLGMTLSTAERFRARISYYGIGLAKAVFLRWTRLRNRI